MCVEVAAREEGNERAQERSNGDQLLPQYVPASSQVCQRMREEGLNGLWTKAGCRHRML